MRITLPKIYAITDTRISGISHGEQVARLIAGGFTLIQLRDKEASPRAFYESAKAAVSIARKHGTTIIINDHVDIALAIGADGVHLGQNDLPPEHARSLLGPQAIIGYSTHSLEQACFALRYPIDYLAIGPVFRTGTKENPDPIVGIETVKAIRHEVGQMPLVAIGGINFDNLRGVLKAGADSAAIIGGLISDGNAITKTAEKLIFQADRED